MFKITLMKASKQTTHMKTVINQIIIKHNIVVMRSIINEFTANEYINHLVFSNLKLEGVSLCCESSSTALQTSWPMTN